MITDYNLLIPEPKPSISSTLPGTPNRVIPVPVSKFSKIHVVNGVIVRDCELLIDASCSMLKNDWHPSRIEAALEAARAYAKRLAEEEPDARIAIVSYSEVARIVLELTEARKYERIIRAINDIRTEDITNIADGLQQALNLLENSNRYCQVVLLSDGCHNTGPEPQEVADKLKEFAVLECVGIGQKEEIDETLLMNLASPYPDGTKRYRWIGDKERLVQHFHKLAGRIARSK